MPDRPNDELGETLVEIIVAIVVIGLIVTAFFAAIVSGSRGSVAHRDVVTADSMLRDYAEAIKAAVQDSATGCGATTPSTFAVATPPARAGINVFATPRVDPGTCPSPTQVMVEHLTAVLPGRSPEKLDIEVRTP